MQFHSFDEAYVERLRAGDFRTQEHFAAYFSGLIQLKLRSRLSSRECIEDVRQETFVRVLTALRDGKILHPERLGSYVNSMCENVLFEYYRFLERHKSDDNYEDAVKELPTSALDSIDIVVARETEKLVRKILGQLPKRDQQLFRQIFYEERDKDEICREFGVDRQYLRVLLHRAKQSFKKVYKKSAK